MKFKEGLYLRIISGSKFLTRYFEAKLGEYYTRKNHEYADAFLKKFRAKRDQKYVSSLEPYSVKSKKASSNIDCDHLKGGKFKSRYSARDYSVVGHTFPDGTAKIWCAQGCGFVSYFGDQNWKLAVEMLRSSSNIASSSERIMQQRKGEPVPVIRTVVTAQDSVPNGRS